MPEISAMTITDSIAERSSYVPEKRNLEIIKTATKEARISKKISSLVRFSLSLSLSLSLSFFLPFTEAIEHCHDYYDSDCHKDVVVVLVQKYNPSDSADDF